MSSTRNCEPFVVGLPDGTRIVGDREIRDCAIRIGSRDWAADLIVMKLKHEDIILGMDWLTKYKAIMDLGRRKVTVIADDEHKETFVGRKTERSGKIISALKARRLLEKGCMGYLCYIPASDVVESKLESIPVVREFPEVFPEELPGLPPHREVEFPIDWETNTVPISKAPYRMAPAEMQELKE